jgi:hypothetical protein
VTVERVTSDDERERRAERATAKRETSDGGESYERRATVERATSDGGETDE